MIEKLGITVDTVKEKHPELHKAILKLIESNPLKYASLKANFSGRYENRRVTYGKLFSVLEEAGHNIEIGIK